MMSKRYPVWIINPLLSIASFCLFLAGIEIFCRILPCGEYDELRINDPYYYIETIGDIRHHLPFYTYMERVPLRFDFHSYYTKTDGIVPFNSNQFGARWLESGYQEDADTTVLVLGDSFTYGHGLYYSDTFVFRLEQNLNDHNRSIRFMNLAERGADARDVLKTYERYKDSISHSVVLYGLHVNDLVNFSTSSAITNLLAVPWLVRHSKGIFFLTEKLERHWFRRFKIGRMTSCTRFKKSFFRENMAAITRLNAAAHAQGARLVVVVLPIVLDLKQDTFLSLYGGILHRLKNNRIECIDLTRSLDNQNDEDMWILPFDQHPNHRANALFATRLSVEFRRFYCHERRGASRVLRPTKA